MAIPPGQNVVAAYPAVLLKGSANRRAALAFVAYLTSKAAQATLVSFGFSAA